MNSDNTSKLFQLYCTAADWSRSSISPSAAATTNLGGLAHSIVQPQPASKLVANMSPTRRPRSPKPTSRSTISSSSRRMPVKYRRIKSPCPPQPERPSLRYTATRQVSTVRTICETYTNLVHPHLQIPQTTSYVFQTSIVTKTVTKTLTMIGGIIKYTPDGEFSTKDTSHTPTSATATATTTEHASVTPMYRNQIPQSTSVVYQTTIFTKIVTMTMTTIGGKPGYTDIESWTTSSTSTKSTRTTPMWTFPNPNRPSSSTKTKTTTASSATASPTTTGIWHSTPVWSSPDRPQQPTVSLRR
jgi:hypothetical protein